MSAADAIAVGWNNDSNIHIYMLQKILKCLCILKQIKKRMPHCKFVKFFIITKMKVQNKMQEITQVSWNYFKMKHWRTRVLLKFA